MNAISIKICGLTREQDVHAAVAAGANAIGFVLYPPSPRYVTPERAAALAALLPAFVTPVLLFVNASANEIQHAANSVPGAWLQFHGDESPDFCQQVAQNLCRRWIRVARIPRKPLRALRLLTS
jgi:phosphoribosylanthranilate isomerase